MAYSILADRAREDDRMLLLLTNSKVDPEDLTLAQLENSLGFDLIELDEETPEAETNIIQLNAFVDHVNRSM
jgi:hypothetical protein